MPIFMAAPTSEGNVLIVHGLLPYLIMVFQLYEIWQWLCDVHVDVDSSIGGVPSPSRGVCNLNEGSNRVVDPLKDF